MSIVVLIVGILATIAVASYGGTRNSGHAADAQSTLESSYQHLVDIAALAPITCSGSCNGTTSVYADDSALAAHLSSDEPVYSFHSYENAANSGVVSSTGPHDVSVSVDGTSESTLCDEASTSPPVWYCLRFDNTNRLYASLDTTSGAPWWNPFAAAPAYADDANTVARSTGLSESSARVALPWRGAPGSPVANQSVLGWTATPGTSGSGLTASPISSPTITITGEPSNPTGSTTATFTWATTGTVTSTTCAIDGGTPSSCSSGQTYNGLAVGSHSFVVSTVGPGGSATATYSWTQGTPTTLTLTGKPSNPTVATTSTATFTWTTTGTITSTTSSLDGATATSCSSGQNYTLVQPGNHTFTVTVTGSGGTVATPYSWTQTAPVSVTLTNEPTNPTVATNALFTWSTTGTISSTTCSLDGATATSCVSGQRYSGLSVASHSFAVTVSGPGGSQTSTYSWTEQVAPQSAFDVITGPDNNIWFTEISPQGRIFKEDPVTRIMTPYTLPTANAVSEGIVAGPDNNIWVSDNANGKIDKIVPSSGAITVYTIPESAGVSAIPSQMISGPGGYVWFLELVYNSTTGTSGYSVGRVDTSSGTITQYALTDPTPESIVAGPDGNVWIEDIYGGTNHDGEFLKMSPTTGSILATYSLPSRPSYPIDPWGVVVGPDNNIWFTETNNSGFLGLGEINTSGTLVAEYNSTIPAPSGGGEFFGTPMTVGPDGNIWIPLEKGDGSLDAVYQFNVTSHAYTDIETLPSPASQIDAITAGPDGNVWFALNWSSTPGYAPVDEVSP